MRLSSEHSSSKLSTTRPRGSGRALFAVCFLLGCGETVAPSLAEAEAAQKAGTLEKAADAFDRVCPEAPQSPACKDAPKRAGEARLGAAEAAVKAGEFIRASHLAWQAQTEGGEAADKATKLVGEASFVAGLAAERARKYGASPATSGALPVDAEKAAAERKRQQPLLKQADSFLAIFAQGSKQQALYKACIEEASKDAGSSRSAPCRQSIYNDIAEDGYRARYLSLQNNLSLWRKMLRSLDDEPLAAELDARREQALADGEVPPVGPLQKAVKP